MATFPLLPFTGGIAFVNNLRYGLTALMLAMVLAPLAVTSWARARVVLALVCLVCVATNLASDQRGRVEAWPGHHGWGFLVAAVVLAGAWWWSPERRRLTWMTLPPRLLTSAVAAAVVVSVIGGWFLQRHYLENRYLDSGLEEDVIHRPFGRVSDSHVDVVGEDLSYAMFGSDLSNDVTLWNDQLDGLTTEPVDACRFWRAALEPGPGYIAVGTSWLRREITPEERAQWFGRDPAVIPIINDGAVGVYYHDRPLSPSLC